MKLLIDTNIILEIILQRERFEQANRLMDALHDDGHELFITSGSFYGLLFTVDKYLRKVMLMENPRRTDTVRSIMKQVLSVVDVVGQDKQTLLDAIQDFNFKDLEDSCQHQTAVKQNCDYLLTFNVKDFTGSVIPVLPPEEFLSRMRPKI